MPGQVTLDATLTANPPASGGLPSGVTSITFPLSPAKKPFTPATGAQSAVIDSASAFVPLFDADAGQVKNGNLLALRTNARCDVRITQKGASGETVKVIEGVKGLLVIELEEDRSLQMLEVMGTATTEWWISGNS